MRALWGDEVEVERTADSAPAAVGLEQRHDGGQHAAKPHDAIITSFR